MDAVVCKGYDLKGSSDLGVKRPHINIVGSADISRAKAARMPRRKQPRPLHLDACDRLGSLLEHGICSESGEDGSLGDEHVCGKCRLEFITLADFLQHKRLCTRKRLVLLVGEDSCDELGADPNSPFSEEFKEDLGKYDRDMPTIPYIASSPYDKPPYSPDSTGMPALIPAKGSQTFTDCEDQLTDLENYAKSETYANSEESFTNDIKRASEHVSLSNSSSLPQYLLMQPVPDTNVTLQALQNTRVAVAQQGAGANNLSHLALHTALYTLQQQQIIQLHQVIQQLQSQLVGSSNSTSSPLLQNSPTVNTLTGSAALTPPQSTDGNNGGVLALTTTAPSLRTLESVTQSGNLSATVTPTTTTSCNTTSAETHSTLSSVPPPPPPHEPNTLELLQRHTEQALQNTMAGSSFLLNGLSGFGNNSDILRFCKKGDIKKEGNEEAFFRHRCRFCGKVFGSDSALQIHIRSHTGERPFKCNVCGNRFSTKGNLKVHFGRHKEKYPHIKMNPHPVPLHLDNLHPPIEPPETSETPPVLTSSSTCQTVALNLQPPNLVPAQPIPLITHGHDKILQSPSDMVTQETDRQSNDMNTHIQTQSLSPNEASNLSDDSDASVSYGTDENGLKEADPSRYEDDIDNDDDSFSESPKTEQKDLDDNAEEDSKHMISENKGSLRIARIAPSFISSSAPTFPNFFRPSLSPSFTMAPICYPPMSTPPPLTTTPTSRPLVSNSGNNENNEQAGRSPDPNFYQDLLPKPGSNDNSWESLMEVTKTSETSKLQQLVDNIEHKLSDPNQCVVCHRVLSCKSALQMHYRTHTGERPFRCKICSRAFTTKGNLKTHMGVHRVKPPLRVLHQCPVCHKQFTNSLVLQQHIRMHTGAQTDMHPEQIMANEVRSSHLPPTSFPRPMIPALITNFSSSPLPLRASPNAPPINCPPKKTSDTACLASSPPTPLESVIKSASKSKDTQMMDDSSSPVTIGTSSRPPSAKPERCTTPPPPVLTTESHPGPASTPVTSRSISPIMDKPLVSSAPYSPAYTASLVALENHVKAINTTIPQPLPFSPFGMGFTVGGFLRYDDSAFANRGQTKDTNSEKSPAPTHSYSPSPNTSKAGSDASGDERSTPGSIVKAESPVSVQNSHLTSTSVITTKTESGALDLTPKNSVISIPPSVPEIKLFPSPLASLPFPTTPGRLSTTCRICFKTFACNSALEIHYRSHTKERPFKCTVCDRGFTTKGNMKQHLLTHKSRDLQPLLFASADNSVQEVETNSSTNVASPCTSSPLTSANESNMSQGSNPISEKKDQLPSVVSTNSLTSSTCSTIISSVSQLTSMSANITPPKTIKIENESTTKRSLPEHNNGSPAKKNSGIPKHFCITCQKPFSSASALQIHNRTHSGEKPFKCVVCGRAFTTKGNLKVHMNIHLSPQNNGTSRRGRRMSLEFQTPPPLSAHGKNDFPTHTRPELYFPYFNPGYMNGIGGPAKMNEISVIQTPASIANGNPPNSMALTPAVSMMTPVMALGQQPPFVRKHSVDGESNEYADPRSPDEAENLKVQPSPSRPPESTSPVRSICSSPPSGASLEKSATWSWKTACNLCNKIYSSTSDLEIHLKSHCNPAVQDTVRSVTQTAKNAAS